MRNYKQTTIARFLGMTLGSALLAFSTQGQAAMQCGDRTALLKVLSEKYKEKPRALGLTSTGKAMFEVYTSKTGTWTIVMTTTSGVTCIMAAGHSWEEAIQIAEAPQV